MQAYNGHLGTGGFAQPHKRNVVYDLNFTIKDPTNAGYGVVIDTRLTGYSTALWTFGTNASAVVATSTGLSRRIDTNTSDATDTLSVQLNDLSILGGGGATANQNNPFVHNLSDNTESHDAGSFTGARSFGLRFTSLITPTTNVFLQNNQRGQGSVSYGLLNVAALLDATGATQTGDLVLADLGHFVTVRISGDTATAAAPAPPTAILLTRGLIALLRRTRSKS